MTQEPEKITSIDAEYLSGKRFAYQEDLSLVEDVDLDSATPGDDINWLEDVNLLSEDGVPAGECYHCHTGRCPVGITTQDPELRKRLVVEEASERVYNFLTAMTMELQMLARA